MRRWALAVAVLVAALSIGWLALGLHNSEHARMVKPRRIDVAALNAEVATRLERMRALTPVPARSTSAATSAHPSFGKGVAPGLGTDLTKKPCVLGPYALCTTIMPLVTACDGGDARACIAVGSYLADTPPRPLIANAYFLQACRIGDVEGCERLDDTKGPVPDDCAANPYVCAWRASRTKDLTALDKACALGVADACAVMADVTKDELDVSRAYYEAGCQLGSPMQCEALGHALLPTCTPSPDQPCYPPDPAQAAAALAIACEAGWGGSDCP